VDDSNSNIFTNPVNKLQLIVAYILLTGQGTLTFRRPCIVIHCYNKTNEMH